MGGLELQLDFIGEKCDEFGVCWFAAGVRNRVAEELAERFLISTLPRELNGVPDGALDPGGGRMELPRDLRIEHLRDSPHHVLIVDGHHDGFAQILISLHMRRNSHIVNH